MVAKDKELPGLIEPRGDLVQAAKKVAVDIAGCRWRISRTFTKPGY